MCNNCNGCNICTQLLCARHLEILCELFNIRAAKNNLGINMFARSSSIRDLVERRVSSSSAVNGGASDAGRAVNGFPEPFRAKRV